MRRGCLLLIICFLLVTSYGLPPPVSAVPLYDFVAGASSASWSSGAGSLPWPGLTSDARGFALYRSQVTLEDGVVRAKVLQTHPQWVDAGWIQGYYPVMTVPANAQLAVTVGFIQGATASDGVIFRVYFQQGQTRQTLVDQRSYHDGHLDTVSVDLAPYAGTSGSFILYVNALKGSGQDWAVWASASIEQVVVVRPDLTVTAMRRAGSNVYYTLANVGTAPCGTPNQPASHYTALVIDGQLATQDHVTVSLNPGASVERQFSWQYAISGAQDTIRVCADYQQNVQELSESNNCKEETWTQDLPDLVVDQIRCETGNHITFIVKNAGTGPLSVGWMSLADVFVDGIKKGSFNLTAPTSTTGGGIAAPGGTSTYVTALTLAASVAVRVIVDSTSGITESNETNNTKDAKLELCSPVGSLPDLIATDLMLDCKRTILRFTIKNVGEATAAAGHTVALLQGTTVVAQFVIDSSMPPGTEQMGWFLEFHPIVSVKPVTFRLCADHANTVTETSETNNCLDKAVQCTDVTPPVITDGPHVTDITTGTVTVSWSTDEDADSTVLYDDRSGMYARTSSDSGRTKSHTRTLTGLTAGIAYHGVVRSRDAAGNTVTSADFLFMTAADRDGEKPDVALRLPVTLAGRVRIAAEARDNKGVDRVIFLVDGAVSFTDATPPYEFDYDLTALPDGPHTFGAHAIDAAGNVGEAVTGGGVRNRLPAGSDALSIVITSPRAATSLYGDQTVAATVSSLLAGRISRTRVRILFGTSPATDATIQHTTYHWLPRPVYCPAGADCDAGAEVEVFAPWDTTGVLAGVRCSVVVDAWDTAGNTHSASVTLTKVEEPVPATPLTIVRTVTRDNSHFDVVLSVTNPAPDRPENHLRDVVLRDSCYGFQPAAVAGVTTTYTHATRTASITVQLLGEFGPGTTRTARYSVVPIFFDPDIPTSRYAIGSGSIGFSFTDPYGRVYARDASCPVWVDGSAVDAAFATADELIITSPEALEHMGPPTADRYALLATCAELATERLGALAYVEEGTSAEAIRTLMRWTYYGPPTRWGLRLKPGWQSTGYLLIVGEAPIIPAWSYAAPGFFTDLTHDIIEWSDYGYTDINDFGCPDLRVGRILGTTAAELTIPLRTSIDVKRHTGGASYLAATGLFVGGYEGTWETHVRNLQMGKTAARALGITVSDTTGTAYSEYFTTRRTVLSESLKILNQTRGGATYEADLGGYTLEQLAAWLLDIRGELPAGEASLFTDSEGHLRRMPPGFGDAGIAQGVAEAERVEAENASRGGTYGYSYTYYDRPGITEDQAGQLALGAIAGAVKSRTSGKDILMFYGHGGPGSWACVLDDWTVSFCPLQPISFGSSRPVVLAWSCMTGDYMSEPGKNIARGFLRNGAGAYVGATEVSSTGKNERVAASVFWEEFERTGTIGDAMWRIQTRLTRTRDPGWLDFVHEYNLYGDPKFGGE